MAVSEVSIVNLALQKLGATRIEALDQDHPNARSMNAAYEATRNKLLRRYPWSFAITRLSVAADAAQTVWGNLNQFPLPADFARLIRDDETGVRTDWKIEGRFVVTTYAAPLEFKYGALVTDPTIFDAMFVDALACALAMQACKEITGSDPEKAGVTREFLDAINLAKSVGAIEKDPDEGLEDDWLIGMR